MFDVLAKLPVNYLRAPFNTPEREMAKELIQELGPGDLLVLDRGYPGYEMFHAIIKKGVDFLIRLPKDGLFKQAKELLARGKRDGKIILHPPKALVKANPIADYQPLTLRIVIVALPGSKEAAVFITALLERPKYLPGALRNLYHCRWQEEEFCKTIKEHLRAEDFCGKSVQFIDQELLSTYLYYFLTRIMMLEAAQQHAQPAENFETKAALIAWPGIWTDYSWPKPWNNAKTCAIAVSPKYPGEPIAPDRVGNFPADQKAAMANGPTNGLKSTALAIHWRLSNLRLPKFTHYFKSFHICFSVSNFLAQFWIIFN